MARSYRLWIDRDSTGKVASCGLFPLTKRDERPVGQGVWDHLSLDTDYPLSGPWALLLRLINMAPRIQPEGWPFKLGEGYGKWDEANEGLAQPDWTTWKSFGAEARVPYFRTFDHGRPVIWFPATDGEWYGFFFDFGLQQTGWNWWVAGQPARWEPASDGSVRFITHETHDPAASLHMLGNLISQFPPNLFQTDETENLSLRETLDLELKNHSAEERDRCHIHVYNPLSPGHGTFNEETPFAVQVLEDIGSDIANLAWTWLSPLAGLWDFRLRADFAIETASDANVQRPETAHKLAKLSPQQKFTMTYLGAGGVPGSGDPLNFLLNFVHPEGGVRPYGASRIISSLINQTQNKFVTDIPKEQLQDRRLALANARRQLLPSTKQREFYVTTDIFAAAALQLEWAVEAELTLLSCPHPGCGRAFFRESDYTGKFCPRHRSDAARKARSRIRLSRLSKQEPKFGQ